MLRGGLGADFGGRCSRRVAAGLGGVCPGVRCLGDIGGASVLSVSWRCLGGVLEILPRDLFKRACVGILPRDHL